MRLISFSRNGKPGYGAVTDKGIVDLSLRIGGQYDDLKSFLASGDLPLAQSQLNGDVDIPLDEVIFEPVIPNPDKIICVGLNYEDHRIETGREPSGYPVLFTRFANCQVGHDQPMIKPKNSDNFDYEGELALVIGKPARHVSRADALDHIAGYACYNDGSIRDWQGHTHQFTPGKNFTGTGAFGPWLVTADEIPDPAALTLTTRLNGQVVQQANTNQLIFNIPFLIEYISSFMELVPGDVIVTGTPGGVGAKRTPPLWMKAGDSVEVDVSGIGTLVNPIVAEQT